MAGPNSAEAVREEMARPDLLPPRPLPEAEPLDRDRMPEKIDPRTDLPELSTRLLLASSDQVKSTSTRSQTSKLSCPTCGGDGMVMVPAPWAERERLLIVQTFKGSAAFKDEIQYLWALVVCWEPGCAAAKERARGIVGMPEDALQWRFDRGWKTIAGQAAAVNAAMEVLADRDGPSGFFTLVGDYGRGKTCVLWALMNHLADAGFYGRYILAEPLIDMCRRVAFDEGSPGALNRLLDARVLAIDELDKYAKTEWGRAKMQEIFDHRYRMGLRGCTLLAYNDERKLEKMMLARIYDGRNWRIELSGPDIRSSLKRARRG